MDLDWLNVFSWSEIRLSLPWSRFAALVSFTAIDVPDQGSYSDLDGLSVSSWSGTCLSLPWSRSSPVVYWVFVLHCNRWSLSEIPLSGFRLAGHHKEKETLRGPSMRAYASKPVEGRKKRYDRYKKLAISQHSGLPVSVIIRHSAEDRCMFPCAYTCHHYLA